MSDDLRPLPNDPDRETVASIFRMDAPWWLTAGGEYQAAAVEVMKDDGTNYDRCVALEWPARLNKTKEDQVLRLLISPEDAIGLAQVLVHTAAWMLGLPPLEVPE